MHFALCVSPFAVHAQELVSKRGEPILPEQGNWGITFNAAPLINYFGNLLNSSDYSTPELNFPKNYEYFTIVLKKFKKNNNKKALRLLLSTEKAIVAKYDSLVIDLGGTDSFPTVHDKKEVTAKNVGFGFGFQKYRYKGRLAGYIGTEFLFSISGGEINYSYGGAPLSDLVFLHTNTFGQGRGVTNVTLGRTIHLGGKIIIGAEYFFAPKISLSAEYAWVVSYRTTAQGKTTAEHWDFNSHSVKTTVTNAGTVTGSSFGFDSDNAGGAVNLSFYF